MTEPDRGNEMICREIRDFRQATMASLNAMHEDLTDLSQRMAAGFADMCDRLDAFLADHRQIADMVTTLASRVRDK